MARRSSKLAIMAGLVVTAATAFAASEIIVSVADQELGLIGRGKVLARYPGFDIEVWGGRRAWRARNTMTVTIRRAGARTFGATAAALIEVWCRRKSADG